MNEVENFVANNTHQLGYIMQEASRQWRKHDPRGALTVGACAITVEENGDYHTLLKELELRKKYEGFLKSVIKSGQKIRDEQTFEWFSENLRTKPIAISPDRQIHDILERTKKAFPNHSLNSRKELILEPINNIWITLNDLHSELDFKCKMISSLSRACSKGLSDKWQKVIRKGFNEIMGTDFSKEEMRELYCFFGGGTNKGLCVKFVESNYDFSILQKKSRDE